MAVKEGVSGFTPLALTELRVAGAALLFAAIYLVWHGPRRPQLTRREWGFMALAALSGVAFNQFFFISGVARSSVAHAGLIVAVGPVMVLVLSCLLRLEALTVLKFVGMLVSFAGVTVLTLGKGLRGNGSYWKGDLILLAGSAVFAYYTILVKEGANRFDAVTLNGVAYLIGLALAAPFGVRSVLEVQWKAIPSAAWWGLGFAIVFGSVVPYLIFAVAMTELTAAPPAGPPSEKRRGRLRSLKHRLHRPSSHHETDRRHSWRRNRSRGDGRGGQGLARLDRPPRASARDRHLRLGCGEIPPRGRLASGRRLGDVAPRVSSYLVGCFWRSPRSLQPPCRRHPSRNSLRA
ncbi:MAG: DMT family transporter [Acidobacteriia bacterium]|nr:DMT family transporter [Terriglobia bacterium]